VSLTYRVRTPVWQRATYNAVAQSIRIARAQLGEHCDEKTANEITWELAKIFKKDNPKFEELRFLAACSPSP
jgi:hypothetical protein